MIPEKASEGESAVGVVLAGGASRRMGRPKASLPFGDATLLDWMVALMRGAVEEVWISVPPFDPSASTGAIRAPDGVRGMIPDAAAYAGPLAALRAALTRLGRPVLFVACDLPFLSVNDLRALATENLGDEAIVLADREGPQPLAALYRPSLLPRIDRLLGEGRRAMHDLLGEIAYRSRLARTAHPGCPPLANINTPEDYAQALERAASCGLIVRQP